MTPHRILSTFDCKPSSTTSGIRDALMLDLTKLPAASTVSLYLPSASATAIADEAARLSGSRTFSKVNPHTVRCQPPGIAYLPIPQAGGNLAGLIDVELPVTVPIGATYRLNVNQLTSREATIRYRPQTPITISAPLAQARSKSRQIQWLTVSGTFQLALTITSKPKALSKVECNLSILRWIFGAISLQNRWYPIFARYLRALAAQVENLGGDPDKVLPSPSGNWNHPDSSSESTPCESVQLPPAVVGKIDGLIYDHFGDFEGFILETEDGSRHEFFSREAGVKIVANRAWADRLRVSVTPETENKRRPRRLVLHPSLIG